MESVMFMFELFGVEFLIDEWCWIAMIYDALFGDDLYDEHEMNMNW